MCNNCCCTEKVFTSNVYYDGAYLPVTGITPEDDGNTILYKIESVLSSTGNFNIVPGTGITVNKVGSTYHIINAAPNVNQSITLNGSVLTLSLGGGSVTLPTSTPQVNADWLATSGAALILNKPTIPSPQTLSWNSGTQELTISSGNTVTITGTTYTAGTGINITGTTISNTAPNITQVLSIVGTTLSLSGGGGTVSLPGADGSETKVNAGTNVTVTGSGTTGSPYVISATNTVYSPGLSLSGNNLTISGGNTVVLPIPAAPDGSETKITAGANVTVTGSGTIASPYVIAAATSIQTLSRVGNNLSISGGNTVTLPVYDGSETKVTAGTGISVTGSGTTVSPYVINSTTTNELENNSYSYRRSVTGNGFDTKGGFATGDTQYISATTGTINNQAYFVVADNSANNIDITLPNPTTFQNRIIWIKAIATGFNVTFSGFIPKNGGLDIPSMNQRTALIIKSSFNGTSWVWESMALI